MLSDAICQGLRHGRFGGVPDPAATVISLMKQQVLMGKNGNSTKLCPDCGGARLDWKKIPFSQSESDIDAYQCRDCYFIDVPEIPIEESG